MSVNVVQNLRWQRCSCLPFSLSLVDNFENSPPSGCVGQGTVKPFKSARADLNPEAHSNFDTLRCSTLCFEICNTIRVRQQSARPRAKLSR